MTRGVAAALQPAGHGTHPQLQLRHQRIDQAAFAHAGGSAKHGDPRLREPLPQRLQPLIPLGAHRQWVVAPAPQAIQPGLQLRRLDPLQLSRFLITAERTGVAVELVLTKADLLPAPELQAWLERLRGWGYDPMAVSALREQGLEPLRQRLAQPGIAVLCGPSGVGKSSLINALVPELELRVSAVSGRLQRGRHTTRHVELFPLAPGALLADTPGFNRPDLPADPAALGPLFPEIRQRLAEAPCRFRNCLHQGDSGCAVGDGWDRHGHYLSCLEAVQAQVEREGVREEREAAATGPRPRGPRREPQIDQRLRQPSRRRQRQGPAED